MWTVHQTLLVVDAMTGQDAVNRGEGSLMTAVGIDGVDPFQDGW